MCRKTHLLYNLFLLFMATFILGCATDELFHPTSTVLPDGRILLNLNYDIPQGQEVMTKSMQSAQDQESGVKNAVLLVFESTAEQARESDRLLQWDTVSVVSSVQQQINFIVSPYKGNCRVKVLANLNEEAFAKVSNYVTVSESATTATTLADFKTLTMPVEVLTNTEKKDFLPLYGALPAVIPGLNSQTDLTVTLKRIYARLNIEVAPSITDFIIHNAYVHNILQTGRFEPYEVGEFPMNYPDKFITMKLASTDQKTVGPFYLYENLEYDSYAVVPTEVILEATYLKDGNQERGFYKILIEYSPDNWNYSCEVNRNTRYKAVIKKVKHYGYRTYDEAIRMPSENTALNIDRKSVV